MLLEGNITFFFLLVKGRPIDVIWIHPTVQGVILLISQACNYTCMSSTILQVTPVVLFNHMWEYINGIQHSE